MPFRLVGRVADRDYQVGQNLITQDYLRRNQHVIFPVDSAFQKDGLLTLTIITPDGHRIQGIAEGPFALKVARFALRHNIKEPHQLGGMSEIYVDRNRMNGAWRFEIRERMRRDKDKVAADPVTA